MADTKVYRPLGIWALQVARRRPPREHLLKKPAETTGELLLCLKSVVQLAVLGMDTQGDLSQRRQAVSGPAAPYLSQHRARLGDMIGEAGLASRSSSFVLTATPSSSSTSSSDLDTESSMMSFFRDNSTSLGSLIGALGASDLLSSGQLRVRELSAQLARGDVSKDCGLSKFWSLISCNQSACEDEGISSGYDYANSLDNDDNLGDGDGSLRPSLGRLLEIERAAHRLHSDVNARINVMFEDAEPHAMNPLFDTASSVSYSMSFDLPTINEEGSENGSLKGEIELDEENQIEEVEDPQASDKKMPNGALCACERELRKLNVEKQVHVSYQCDPMCVVDCAAFSHLSKKALNGRELSRRKVSLKGVDAACFAAHNGSMFMRNEIERSTTELGHHRRLVNSEQTKEMVMIRRAKKHVGTIHSIISCMGHRDTDNCATISALKRRDPFHRRGVTCLGKNSSLLERRESCPLGQTELSCALTFLKAEIISSKKKRHHAKTSPATKASEI